MRSALFLLLILLIASCSKHEPVEPATTAKSYPTAYASNNPFSQSGIGTPTPPVKKIPFSAKYIHKLDTTRLFSHSLYATGPGPSYPYYKKYNDTTFTIKVLSDTTIQIFGKTLYFSTAQPPFQVDTSEMITLGYGNLYSNKFELHYYFKNDSISFEHYIHVGAGGGSYENYWTP